MSSRKRSLSNDSDSQGASPKQRSTESNSSSSSSSSSSSTSYAIGVAPSLMPDGGKRQVVVLLDKASLSTTKTRSGDFELLNCDDHATIARKNGLDPAAYRPDILHQELLALIDSPLSKAGHLKIFVHTTDNVLIELNPKVRIPRTSNVFLGLWYNCCISLRFVPVAILRCCSRLSRTPSPNTSPLVPTSTAFPWAVL